MKQLCFVGILVCALAAVAAPALRRHCRLNSTWTTAPARAAVALTERSTLSQFAAGDVLVDVTLDPDVVGYVATGFPGSFAFNLVDPDPTIAVTFDTPSSGWHLLSPIAGSHQFDGFGDLEYVLICDACGNGGSNPQDVQLTFHVQAPNLTPESFLELSTAKNAGVYFVADIMGSNG